jgi:outer membrane protein TolC/ABC-type uncharacterized transport system substrate-binding protein
VKLRLFGAFFVTIFLSVGSQAGRPPWKAVRIGVMEAGEHIPHSAIRSMFQTQLERIAPDSILVSFPPSGFESALWNRDSCRIQAKRLAARADLDMIVTIGPWVIEDLLAAGYNKPIVGLYRNDPQREGLIGVDGKPLAPNLTVDINPRRYRSDLTMLTRLVKVKKLGVLLFPSGDETPRVMAAIDSIGKVLGFEAVTADGRNKIGTYAFFNAFTALDKPVDAIYMLPMWDMTGEKPGEFLNRAASKGVPIYSCEGRFAVERGALASLAPAVPDAQSWFDAWKALRILQGERPCDMPTDFTDISTPMLNRATAQILKIEPPEDMAIESDGIAAPTPPEAMIYNLSDAVKRALDQNPGYLAQGDALRAAASAANQALSAYLPQISARISAYHVDDNTVYNDRNETRNDRYLAGLSLDQQVFSLSTIRAIQVAAADRAVAEVDKSKTARDLELGVALAYSNCLKADEILATQIRHRRALRRCLQIAKARATLVGDDSLGVTRLSVEQLAADRDVFDADRNCKVARILLNALLNQSGETPFALDTMLFNDDELVREYDLLRPHLYLPTNRKAMQDYLLTEALKGNLQMQRSREEITVQKMKIRQNTARYFPTLGIHGAVNYTDRLQDYPPSFVEKTSTWSLGAELRLPLFLGTDRLAERRRLTAGLSELEYKRDDVSLSVMKKVQSGLLDLFTNFEQTGSALQSARLQASVMEDILVKYQLRQLSYLELIDAARAVRDNSLAAITHRFSYFDSAAEIVRDVGWSPSGENMTPGQMLTDRTGRNLSGGK